MVTGNNGTYYKGVVKDGELEPNSIVPINKVAFQNSEKHVEFHMPHAMDIFLGFRAAELGLEKDDVILKGDKAVLKTEGDLDRFSHLFIKELTRPHFVSMSDIILHTIGLASIFSVVATAEEAYKYNQEHPLEGEAPIITAADELVHDESNIIEDFEYDA